MPATYSATVVTDIGKQARSGFAGTHKIKPHTGVQAIANYGFASCGFGAISGLVLDNESNPVKFAGVTVLNRQCIDVYAKAFTGEDGVFNTAAVVPKLADGVVVICSPPSNVDANAAIYHKVLPQ